MASHCRATIWFSSWGLAALLTAATPLQDLCGRIGYCDDPGKQSETWQKLASKADLDGRCEEAKQATPLYYAVARSKVHKDCKAIVGWLLEHGARVNATTGVYYSKETPLFAAARTGQLQEMNALLEHNASVNATREDGQTPLHLAASKGLYKVASWLVKHNAGINIRDFKWQTPLHAASMGHDVEMMRLLIDHGALVSEADAQGRTPLHYASQGGNVEAITLLLAHGAEVDRMDWEGRTPLWLACKHGSLESAELLLKNGADMMLTDHRMVDPERAAASKGHDAVAIFLHERRSDWIGVLKRTASKRMTWLTVVAAMFTAVVLAEVQARFKLNTPAKRMPAKRGVRLLAANALRKSKIREVSRRLKRVGGVVTNVLFIFGPVMYKSGPYVAFPMWVSLYLLPVAYRYGIRRTVVEPTLTAAVEGTMHPVFTVARPFLLCLLTMGQLEQYVLPVQLVGECNRNSFLFDKDLEFWDRAGTLPFLDQFKIDMLVVFNYFVKGVTLSAVIWGWFVFLNWFSRLSRDQDPTALMLADQEAEEEDRRLTLLAKKLAAVRSPDEPVYLGDPENPGEAIRLKDVAWGPFPLLPKLFLIFLDMLVLDVNTVVTLLTSDNFRFAFCMMTIIFTSLLMECRDGVMWRVFSEVRETLRTGVPTDGLLDMMDREMGFETFYSLALTAYSMPFASRTPLQMFIQIISMATSCFNLGNFTYQRLDLKVGEGLMEEDSEGEDSMVVPSSPQSRPSSPQSRDATYALVPKGEGSPKGSKGPLRYLCCGRGAGAA